MLPQKSSIILLLLLNVLNSSCESTSSLAFVIDDTYSMKGVIEQVKKQVGRIMNVTLEEKSTEIKDFVLVAFNHKELSSVNKTIDQVRFKNALDALKAHNFEDHPCPEMSMGGTKRALEESEHGSYVYVFTDSAADDYKDYQLVIDLCQSKQIQVVIFIIKNRCTFTTGENFEVYYKIAAACTGQVFIINENEMTMAINVIRAKVRGKHTLLASRLVPAYQKNTLLVNVDDKVISVLIATAGENVDLQVSSPNNTVITEQLMWSTNSKAVELTHLVSGNYSVTISGHSTTSAVITGRTNFSFRHGFSIVPPISSTDTVTQPIADELNFLSVTVTDPDNDVTIERAQILDMNDNILKNLSLNWVTGDFFRSYEFLSPNHMIKIAVVGSLKSNGQTVRRISKTPVQPKPLTIKPSINKSQKKIETTDAKIVKIPCVILKAKPQPRISWYFKRLSSSTYERYSGNTEELTVNINDSTLSGEFKCVAENEAGRDEHITELSVTLKPTITIDKGTKISIKYSSTISVKCNVTAKPEPSVEWRDDHNIVIPARTQRYQKSTGNAYFEYVSTLTLKNIKISRKYYCHSSNKRGSTSASIDVTVLPPFQRHGLPEETRNLSYGKSYTIPCKVESELPVKIKWFFTPEQSSIMESIKSSNKYHLSSNGSALIIRYMDLDLRGKFRCSVTLISDEKETQSYDVNLKIHDLTAPKLKKLKRTLTVREKAPATISCDILKSIPKPTVTWYFKNKQINGYQKSSNVGEHIHIKNVTLEDAGIYKCIATNNLGNDETTVELIVEAPARINNNVIIFKGLIGDVALRIPCNVTGYPKPDISWSDREGGAHIMQDQKYSIENGALVIKNPVVADTKKYWCTAKNTFGSDTQSFDGIVTDEIDYENVHEVHILEGDTKKIHCLLPHTPTDSVRWYKNGNIMNVTGPSLHFVNATIFMDANYTCRVSNNLGSNSDTILVIVGYKPTFTIMTDLNIIDWKGEGDLNCEVSAKPTATAEWFHNGNLLKSVGDYLQMDIFDWGEYTCRISNVHGTVERTFNVSSEACLVNRDDESVINTPIILSELHTWPDYNITNKYLNFDSGEKFKLLCPNTSNAFQNFPEKSEMDVTCNHENKFLFEGKVYKYSDFHCNRQVMPVIRKTGNRCLAENSETIRVGFAGKSFIEAYEVCLDTHENLPLYTYIKLTSARYSADESRLKWFKYSEIERRNQDKIYTCGSNITSCCYTKGQLINATDVTFGPVQTSTYVDHLNAIPIWQPCTERTSWSDIEDVIRTQLIILNTLSVWTGASKYTEKNGGKIPRYLWKVIKSDEDLIAVVYVNEPTPEDTDIFCQNICDGNSMLWLTPKDKFTYCCKLQDFLVAFDLPNNIFL